MTPIIAPIDTALIKRELTAERFLRKTNKANNEIYVVDAYNSPHTMREIGRLREITFRASGGGTGKDCDIDEFDLMDPPCQQMIVWNPEEERIIGAYRFLDGRNVRFLDDGTPRIAIAHMFRFSKEFIEHYLPHTIELGRSFVIPEYQSTKVGVKAIYALDNLWDGLGALPVVYPHIKHLLGKMTMYPSYPTDCRDMLLCFLNRYFPDPDALVTPIEQLDTDYRRFDDRFAGNDFKTDYKVLNSFIRDHGINIPPLVNAYMSLSPTMRVFGTAINHEFGEVEETGIFYKIDEITDQKKSRHIDTFRG